MAPSRRSSDSNAASSRSLTKRLSSSPSVTATRSDRRAARREHLKTLLNELLAMCLLRKRLAATSHCFERGHFIRKLPKKLRATDARAELPGTTSSPFSDAASPGSQTHPSGHPRHQLLTRAAGGERPRPLLFLPCFREIWRGFSLAWLRRGMSRDEVEKVLGKTALVQLEEGIKLGLWTGRGGGGVSVRFADGSVTGVAPAERSK